MALPSDEIRRPGKKGKAVLLIHTWKDYLWEMGSKPEVPEDSIFATSNDEADNQSAESSALPAGDDQFELAIPLSAGSGQSETLKSVTYTAKEATELLNLALIQSISESLSSLPSSAFPMPATTLYSNYILPSRPAFPTRILPPANSVASELANDVPATEITIKSSSHKSLTAFLKAAEKRGLLVLKIPQKQQPDVLVMSVNASHPSVESHVSFVTMRKLELKEAKKVAREEKEKEADGSREVHVKELFKPHQASVDLLEAMGARFGRSFMIDLLFHLLPF